MIEDPEHLQAEYRRRMIRGGVLAGVAIFIGIIGVPLLKGKPYSLPVILLTLAFTIPVMACSYWIVKRLGGYDLALYAETRKRSGETRWQWYRRFYTAAPRHRPIYRMYLVIGPLFILISFVSLLSNRWQFVSNLLLGIGFLLMGGAEYLPSGQRRRATMMRIASVIVLLIALPIIWVSIFRS